MIRLALKFLIDYYEYVTGVPVISTSVESLIIEKEEQISSNSNSNYESILKFLKSKNFLATAGSILSIAGLVYMYDPNGVVIIKFLTDSFVNISSLITKNSQNNLESQAKLAAEIIKNQEQLSVKTLEDITSLLRESDNTLQLTRLAADITRILITVTRNNINPISRLTNPNTDNEFPGAGVTLSQDPEDTISEIE
jgi:hypothetical protein